MFGQEESKNAIGWHKKAPDLTSPSTLILYAGNDAGNVLLQQKIRTGGDNGDDYARASRVKRIMITICEDDRWDRSWSVSVRVHVRTLKCQRNTKIVQLRVVERGDMGGEQAKL